MARALLLRASNEAEGPYMVDHDAVAAYIAELRPRQVPYVPHPSVLSFLATTGAPRSFASVAVAELVKLTPGAAATDMDVHLRGSLPRALRAGENLTVSVSRYEESRGYQIKTLPLRALGAESESYATAAAGRLLVHGRQAFTTHHGPYELNFFERIPFDEVQRTVGRCTHAVMAVGSQVNVSPRLVWYHELAHGRLATFHGDGVMMKTYRNLMVNKQTVRMVFDFERLTGFALFGTCEEVSPEAHPAAWKETCAGFAALGFGKPSRMFRHVCERFEPIAVRGVAKA